MKEAQIKKIALEAKQKWLDEHFGSKKAVEAWVAQKMDKGATEIMLKLLGFDKRYGGGWSIDHCNGRNGNSVIGDYINSACRIALEKWAKDNFGNLPALEPSAVLDIHREYQKKLVDSLKSKARSIAETNADKLVDSIVSSSIRSEDYEVDEELPF